MRSLLYWSTFAEISRWQHEDLEDLEDLQALEDLQNLADLQALEDLEHLATKSIQEPVDLQGACAPSRS